MSTSVMAEIAFGVELPSELCDWIRSGAVTVPCGRHGAGRRGVDPDYPPDGICYTSAGDETYWLTTQSIINVASGRHDTERGARPLHAAMFDPLTIEIYTDALQTAFAAIGKPMPGLAQWLILTDVSLPETP